MLGSHNGVAIKLEPPELKQRPLPLEDRQRLAAMVRHGYSLEYGFHTCDDGDSTSGGGALSWIAGSAVKPIGKRGVSKAGGWWLVHFEDGDRLEVHIAASNCGTAWRPQGLEAASSPAAVAAVDPSSWQILADSSDAVNAAEPQPAGATGHEQLATSVFSSDAVRRAMRRNTWCSGRTDEPALDLPGDACARLPVYTNTSRTGVRAGFGAFASRALAEGEYIGEYTGEIIRTAKLDQCDGGGGGGRAESQFVFDLGDGFAVDAQRVGNRLRRANHCGISPNVRAQVVNHRGVRKVCMYAAAAVAVHEELLFDYGPLFSESLLR